jgi:hypothetical protein
MALDFLTPEGQATPIHIPTEGFATTGFVAQWMGKVLYSFMLEDKDIAYINSLLTEDEEKVPEPAAQQKLGDSGWIKYWYLKDTEAREAANLVKKHEGLDRRPGISTVWRFEAKSETCLNLSAAAQDAFGDVLGWESQISTLGSVYRRHEFHFISLPAAIAAAASAMGFDNPGFDLSELTEADVVYTPAFQVKMIGAEPQEQDSGKYKHVNAKGGYSDSLLWQRRADLWAALGEEDPKKFRRIGSGTKHDTSSKQLNICLRIVEAPWMNPTWALLVPVRDPRLDATSKSGTRLTIPALTAIYQNQEEAQTAAQELTGGEAAAVANNSKPRLPTLWAGNESNWQNHVAKVKEALGSKPPILPNITQAIIEVQGSLENAGLGQGVTVQDYINWM